MPLPKVSETAARFVARRSMRGSEIVRVERVLENYKRLSIDNPTIGQVMFHMVDTESFQQEETNCLVAHAFGYGTEVYKLLEMELKARGQRMPIVSGEVIAPLGMLGSRDFDGYLWTKFSELLKGENPEIAKAAIRWFTHFERNHDRPSVNKVLLVGTTVYRLIESQWDANELLRQLNGKL